MPRTVPKAEFESIISTLAPHEVDQLKIWFFLDTNAIPAEYLLQPISTHYPDIISNNYDRRQTATNEWYQASDFLRTAICKGAKCNLPPDKAEKYQISGYVCE